MPASFEAESKTSARPSERRGGLALRVSFLVLVWCCFLVLVCAGSVEIFTHLLLSAS